MVTIKVAVDYEDQLTALMEDYVRMTQLQLSLRKRIETLMNEREEAAKAQEETARLQWEDAKSKTQKLGDANELLKLKMRRTNSLGLTSLVEAQIKVKMQGFKQERSPSPMIMRGRSRTPASLRTRSSKVVSPSYSASPPRTRSPSVYSVGTMRSLSPPKPEDGRLTFLGPTTQDHHCPSPEKVSRSTKVEYTANISHSMVLSSKEIERFDINSPRDAVFSSRFSMSSHTASPKMKQDETSQPKHLTDVEMYKMETLFPDLPALGTPTKDEVEQQGPEPSLKKKRRRRNAQKTDGFKCSTRNPFRI